MKILVCMQALWLFRVAVKEGHFGQQQWEEGSPPPPRLEINLHAMTAGVAMLSLYSWLTGLRAHLAKAPGSSLPARLAVVTDKGKSSKEQGNLVVKEAVAAIMNLWEAPFRCCTVGALRSCLARADVTSNIRHLCWGVFVGGRRCCRQQSICL